MSGSETPGGIIFSGTAAPTISFAPAPGAAPPGLPVYPLAAEPGQVWDLQLVNGALQWVQFLAPPGQTAFALEDGLGGLLLEDGAGIFLMEA